MAVEKALYSRWDGDEWIDFYFVTSSDIVFDTENASSRTDDHRFVSTYELNQIYSLLGNVNASYVWGTPDKTKFQMAVNGADQVGASYANRLVMSNLSGYIDKVQLDANVADVYMPKAGGTFSDNVTMTLGKTLYANILKGVVSNDVTIEASGTAGQNINVILKPYGDTGYINASSKQIKNVAEPTSLQDAATKYYVDTKATYGAKPVPPVVLAGVGPESGWTPTTGGHNITIDGTPTGGTSIRVLLMGRATASENGIYLTNSSAWSRVAPTQADELGQLVYVSGGTTNKFKFFWNDPSNSSDWLLHGEMHEYAAGDGLNLTGLTFKIADLGITNAMVSNTAAINFSKLSGYINATETISTDWEDVYAVADVVAATTGNITLSGTQTIDGVAVTAGQRVLVRAQTVPATNGIYLCASGAWTRVAATQAAEIRQYVRVAGGSTLSGKYYRCNPSDTTSWTVDYVATAFTATQQLSFIGTVLKKIMGFGTSKRLHEDPAINLLNANNKNRTLYGSDTDRSNYTSGKVIGDVWLVYPIPS